MENIDNTGLDLSNLPEMVSIEMRICQIMAERAFMDVNHTSVSPGLFMILSLIKNNPGQKQSVLAQSVKLDRSTMVPILDHCARNGWLERKPYAGDKRAHAIFLTSKGKQLVSNLELNVAELEKRISDGMGKTRRDEFLHLLKQFQAVFDD